MPYLVQKSDISYKRQAFEEEKCDTVIICPFSICSLFQLTVLSFSCLIFHFTSIIYTEEWDG